MNTINATSKRRYRGRFAPTPSGNLHFGSLVVAVASYLDAKAAGGDWLLRIEDIDSRRSRREYADNILKTLDSFALHWDESVYFQSNQRQHYLAALQELCAAGCLYCCDCSRKHWQKDAAHGFLGKIYPRYCVLQTCHELKTADNRALRLRFDDDWLSFVDRLRGNCRFHSVNELGDAVLKRSDGDIAYALAVVIDDAKQAISDVVRGADLLAASAIQIYLQKKLALPRPKYLHLPLVLDSDGKKLSKSRQSCALKNDKSSAIIAALAFLNQNIDDYSSADLPKNILQEAVQRWQIFTILPNLNSEIASNIGVQS